MGGLWVWCAGGGEGGKEGGLRWSCVLVGRFGSFCGVEERLLMSFVQASNSFDLLIP